jgi:elongation factor 2 kinase
MTAETKPCNRRRISVLIREAASRAVAEEDVWAKYKIHKLPAERIIRHMYHPETHQWSTDETIVKMEPEPFTHGAMRFCYRLKKMATPPKSASNHRFHSYGWTRASNYVAKCYHKGGEVDTSEEAKQAVRNDIILQYEAAHWAEKFNQNNPPKPIVFIRAYAIEFPDREGQPLFAVERFIAGTDSYGVGFVKHNTNSGFVDVDLHRITPQVFSAYSFYASRGTRLVADIQGVGDLYTDPQVLSIDYRFGDGDLGPRGMALFFHTFRHCHFSDSMGIPIFPLSRNELKNQAKYDEDEVTVSDDGSTFSDERKLDKFARIDLNRQSRRQSLMIPPMKLELGGSQEEVPTARRSNVFKTSAEVSHAIRQSMKMSMGKVKLSRSSSDVNEVMSCLRLATADPVYDHRAFHRKASGEIRERRHRTSSEPHTHKRRGSVMNTVADVIVPTEETKENLGKVWARICSVDPVCVSGN